MAKAVRIDGMRRRVSPVEIEVIEARLMLSASILKHLKLPTGWRATVPTGLTHFAQAADTGSTVPFGLTPDQMRNAYGLGSYGSSSITFNGVQGDGTGQTIAIIDAYDDPNAASDLHNFDLAFGLPDANFTKLSQTGSTTLPGTDPAAGGSSGTWEIEESLDIEWAHVMAPKANIVLYEASDSGSGLFTAVQTANANVSTSVVSMSWGGDEFNGEKTYDTPYFNTSGVTYVASTGDSAGDLEYPANSPNVVAVGGTSLTLNGNAYVSESAWSSGGGGISTQESRPAYQANTATGSTKKRTTPDVSLDADPSTGVPIYDSFDEGASTPWYNGYIGGTSLAAPLFAGIVAVADQGHVLAGSTKLTGKTQLLPDLYSLPASNFHDITTGNNGHAATTGYDLATGIGSPVANLLIPNIAGTATVTGQAFVDNNGNGIFDGSDTVLSNKVVYLDQNNNGIQDSTEPTATTSATGIYTFNNTTAGGTVRLSTALTGYVAIPTAVVGYAASNTINVSVFPTTFSTTTASLNYTLQADPTGANAQILINGSQAYTVAASVISSTALTFSLTGTGDSFTINGMNGNPVSTSGITVTGATSGDVLTVIGTATGNDAFTVTSSVINFGSSPITFSHITSLLLNPGTGLDSLAVNSGAVTVTAPVSGTGILTRNFSSLSIASAATALFATAPLHTDRMLVETASLSALGKLDLGGNDLIVHNGDLTNITGLIGTGFANGAWNGKGITSALAAADTTHITALGVIQNSLYGGSGQPLFDGVSPVSSDVLVKYTYFGDTNLDGKVDGTDYSRVDNGYLFASTGWFNGDFNYDNQVNGSDYTLVDNAFNTQGSPL